VDAAFSRFDLARPDGYAEFLLAQARILPALEALLRPEELVPGWRGRTAELLQDLNDLGVPAPPSIPPNIPIGSGGRLGALYVLEGSRLGGAVLARRVRAELPVAFLSAVHPSGAWRSLLAQIDGAELTSKARHEALDAARSTFAAFERSAGPYFSQPTLTPNQRGRA
jgi:heme oxygenase